MYRLEFKAGSNYCADGDGSTTKTTR